MRWHTKEDGSPSVIRLFFLWAGWPLRIVIGAVILIVALPVYFLLGMLGLKTAREIKFSLSEVFEWIRGDNI